MDGAVSLRRQVSGDVGLPQLGFLPDKSRRTVRGAAQPSWAGGEQNLQNLGQLGLLGQLGFSSRLLPVDLVPLDPPTELISQPEGGHKLL